MSFLISLVKDMCANNDHVTTLAVLQVLGRVRRGGYITLDDQVLCLCYCTDMFAQHDNMQFFNEFAAYMPDITAVTSPENPFSIVSRSYYFVAKYGKNIAREIQLYCPNIEPEPGLHSTILKHRIHQKSQLEPLIERLKEKGEHLTQREYTDMCDVFVPLNHMKTGITML